jgi:hypothetical protein
LIDDVKSIEKSKGVQWDQLVGYRELFRHPQIWERQAAIACPGRSVRFILSHSISAGAHKKRRTQIPKPIDRHAVLDDDLARVSPLLHAHITPNGSYFQSPRPQAASATELAPV